MKKFLSIIIITVLVLGLLSGCGCAKNENTSEQSSSEAVANESNTENTQDTSEDTNAKAEAKPENLPEVSENKDVVTKEKAPKVFIEEGMKGMTYHLESCETIKGKKTSETTWEFVQTIGLWQCPECNPPRYENYTNAD